ncbi:hypothetical protein ABPG74_019931 [Tetrahymena malaccensis]
MEEQQDINLKYEAPVEIFQEIFEDYQKKHKKNMKFDSGDFGESKQFKEGTRTHKLKGCTKNYAAPEYLDENGSYNIKFDIFSLGIILLELTRGQFLESKDCAFIRDGGLQNYMSKNSLYNDLNNIIGQMLQTKSENRINSFELTNQLNKLRIQLENQFISLVQDKMDFSESRQMIYKFKQSFLQFNYTCKQNEVRIDKYSFKGYSNLSKIKDCIAKRLIHHLDLDFEFFVKFKLKNKWLLRMNQIHIQTNFLIFVKFQYIQICQFVC